MLTIYNYEELAEDIQKKVRAREMATETYRRYRIDFYKERREELLLQELGEYTENSEVITLYQPENVIEYKELDVAYYNKQTKKTTVKVFINEETDYQYLSFIVDSFNNRIKDIIEEIEHEAESIEPDFAQYLQDKNFLEDGTEILLTSK